MRDVHIPFCASVFILNFGGSKKYVRPGPGTLPSLLCAIAVETSLAAKGCQDVLILGGHGACGRKISPRCNLISRCRFLFLEVFEDWSLHVSGTWRQVSLSGSWQQSWPSFRGVSGVAAVRAVDPPGKVVIWEPLEDVANVACEVQPLDGRIKGHSKSTRW